MGHANDSIVVFQLSAMTQSKGVISGSDCDLIPIRKFIIQGPSHVKIVGFVSCGCTHVSCPFCCVVFGSWSGAISANGGYGE